MNYTKDGYMIGIRWAVQLAVDFFWLIGEAIASLLTFLVDVFKDVQTTLRLKAVSFFSTLIRLFFPPLTYRTGRARSTGMKHAKAYPIGQKKKGGVHLIARKTQHAKKTVHLIFHRVTSGFREEIRKIGSLLSPILHILHFKHRSTGSRMRKSVRSKRSIHRSVPVFRPSLLYKMKYVFIGVFLSFFFIFLPLLFMVFISDLPTPDNLSINYIPKTTKIYDRNGNLLYEIYANQNRTAVKLNDIPTYLREGTISIEDKDFYNHPGFDIRGIARAFFVDLHNGGLQGGSTITQQLIKSALLTSDPTINRKLREVVLAFWAERVYTKNQILEMYFNYVPYGGSAWGVESASEIYFGKPVSQMDLAQSAFLAGLPRAPSIYSPFSGNGKLWKTRQKEVLQAMVRDRYITQRQANHALQEKLTFKNPDVPIKAPHFVMYVRNLLEQKYGISEVERGGLQVTTTLDLKTQQMAEQTVADEVNADGYLNISNGAALVTNPSNGDILAMVGSKDYFDQQDDGNVNVTTSLRQPGSTIKIVTYTLALSSGFTEATILDDSPLTIPSPDGGPSYSPVNYDGKYHGRVPLRLAFANSLNIPAVRTAQKVGVDNIVDFGKRMGITTWGDPNQYGLSITLGSGDTTMTDLATVYGTDADQGKRVDLDPILQIKDANGKVIYQKKPKAVQVVDPGVAFIISDILADNKARSMEFGPESPLYIPDHRVSVKTGTTDEKRDNWTIGYTPHFLVAAWVGNNDNSPMSQSLASGITGAAPIWHKIMTNLLGNSPSDKVMIPSDVVTRTCDGKTAYFIRGTENSAYCQLPLITPTSTTIAQ